MLRQGIPQPPAIIVPPDETGHCPAGYSLQVDGSCKKDFSLEDVPVWVWIAGAALILMLIMKH